VVLRGYNYRYIRHFVFQIAGDIKDAIAGVQAFCGALVPGGAGPLTITTAEDWGDSPPEYCLNIGLTSSGLQKLIGGDNYTTVKDTSAQLFTAYDPGAVADAANVGDTGPSAPAKWWPSGWQLSDPPTPATPLDILVSLYTLSPDSRDSYTEKLLAMVPNGSGDQPSAVVAFSIDSDPILDSSGNPTPDIHFGYHDGISQPRIQGTPPDPGIDPNKDDLPIVPSWLFVIDNNAPDATYIAHSLLQNGCFGAFRVLYQDVEAFSKFIGQVGNPDLLAAKMCGRWFDGTPLEVSPYAPDANLSEEDLSNFGYLTPTPHQKGPRLPDPDGLQCPFSAHTRRANPRDDTSVIANTDNAQAHRVRRFATAFGPEYRPGLPGSGEAYRGLVGLFMGADLVNQFEFLMQNWIGRGSFRSPDNSPNESGTDALFGPQPGSRETDFDYLSADGSTYEEVPGLSRFIRTDGGLYVFIPSISALGSIGQGTISN
jgi:deferrochelatase/peroxidase EfeB